MSFTLAASAEMIFLDLPFVERVERIAARGLDVEIWDWTTKDIDALRATGANIVSMTGYTDGNPHDEDAIGAFLESARRSLEVADRLGCDRLNVHGTGLGEGGIPIRQTQVVTPALWLRATDTFARLAELGEKAGKVFMLENLNLAVDHPGTPFATAADTRTIVAQVDSPGLRMNLDLYHAQIGEGNLIELCRQSLPFIGEIQVADVPGRCEPGTGEINYSGIARALRDMGYDGTIGLEAFASSDSDAALNAFQAAFSVH